ncbi:DUF2520 domain-containing protein [Alicyclobacillus sp. SP_1]|uniref:DUF2520 domain-containing protein n=1 Tax=Alicyclobacillus sp. SP_1 TaxID=2942475 RepID=UPI0021573069|nr:DUF2520 domain-containing protein [Alicyclobacillus sp. SP_1]
MRWLMMGCGKASTALSQLLLAVNEDIVGAVTPRPHANAGQRYRQRFQTPVMDLDEARQSSLWGHIDIIAVCTPDDRIAQTAHLLSQCQSSATMAIHLSGSLDHHALDALRDVGVSTASMHPLAALTESLPDDWAKGIYFGLEGDERAVATCCEFVRRWNGEVLLLNASDKAKYHAAAVLASNALVALADVAARLMPGDAGIHPLLPLMQTSLDNIARLGINKALTGPVSRGDTATISRHLDALAFDPVLLQLYRDLTTVMAQVADSVDGEHPARRQQIAELFATRGWTTS